MGNGTIDFSYRSVAPVDGLGGDGGVDGSGGSTGLAGLEGDGGGVDGSGGSTGPFGLGGDGGGVDGSGGSFGPVNGFEGKGDSVIDSGDPECGDGVSASGGLLLFWVSGFSTFWCGSFLMRSG